ncbi:UvrD-helicase domain-containing protein [Nocardia sp. NPDC127526]|uniref:UvrD-helicase domain-containing protein n=1 Tax=Nocardia sp. NPDC127526 TaxID=3345393 RepID=UPI003632D28E
MKTQVLIHDLFQQSFDALDNSVRSRVMPFIMKLQQDPDAAGLDLKQPKLARNKYVRTARVNDGYRAVLIAGGADGERAALWLVAVKKHDDAYDYARRLTLQVNPRTGAAELFDSLALGEAVDRARDATNDAAAPLISAKVSQADLERFGVDREVAAELKRVTDEKALEEIIFALPSSQGAAVLDLACGKSADDVWRDLVGEAPDSVDTEDLAEALQRPLSRLSFTAFDVANQNELRAMLEGDLARWRIWLHPLQRQLATHRGWKGPFRVTGGAGTGKTVTAVHRARFLGARLRTPGQKVLFTTFTKNLARSIESQLTSLAGAQCLRNIDVVNIDAVARRVVAASGIGAPALATATLVSDTDQRVRELWSRATMVGIESWDTRFLADEWSQTVLGHGVGDEQGYLRVSRAGRNERLSRSQRSDVWQVIAQFERLMSEACLMTFTQLAAHAAGLLQADRTLRAKFPYRHAVVDEAQDLHPAHWRMIRNLVPQGTDDLFIVGDAHQRIYGRRTPLSRYGIETRGRSRRLTVNYRTSEQILRWCLQIVVEEVDDLDLDVDDFTGARSVFRGPELEMNSCATTTAEIDRIADTITRWNNDCALSDIAVFTLEHRHVERLAEALAVRGIPAVQVDDRSDESALGDEVRVMTMHRAKGLEYRAVALAQLGADSFPPPYLHKLTEYEQHQEENRLRCLLYVAGSRARERLALSWAGAPSPLLAALPSSA